MDAARVHAPVPPVGVEALELQQEASARGLSLRLIGSLAIAARCPSYRHLLTDLGRRPPRDIDFMAYGRDEPRLAPLFAGRGYAIHPTVSHSREWGVKRLIYTHAQHAFKVDVFLDQLVMAHTIDLAGRLELDAATVPLADLLLSKLQIYRITENDLIDLVVLLAEQEVGDTQESIDARRLQLVLGSDWGFWYGALQNLDALGSAITRLALPDDVRSIVGIRIGTLRGIIETAPKTTRWKLRARLGTKVPWYEDVEDIDV